MITFKGCSALVICKPTLLASTTGIRSTVYSLCNISIISWVGTLCLCRVLSYFSSQSECAEIRLKLLIQWFEVLVGRWLKGLQFDATVECQVMIQLTILPPSKKKKSEEVVCKS